MAPASKQLRNRVPKQTCLQRRADVRARGGNSGYGQPKGGQNHSQVNDLWARFKVPEWGVFCHTERLRNSPPRLKLVLSDSTMAAFGWSEKAVDPSEQLSLRRLAFR